MFSKSKTGDFYTEGVGKVAQVDSSIELTEFGPALQGVPGDVVRGQVLEQLLPRPHRHRHELVRPVSGVLSVDDLGEEEVGKFPGLGEEPGRGQRRAEHGHGLGAGHSHAENGKSKQNEKSRKMRVYFKIIVKSSCSCLPFFSLR